MRNQSQQTILEQYGLQLVTILQSNQRKGVSVALVTDSTGRRMIMKHCDWTHLETRKNLNNERRFYSNNTADFTPRMLFSGENFLCLEYIDGVPLLSALQQRKLSCAEATLLVNSQVRMAQFFAAGQGEDHGDPGHFAAEYMRYVSKLFNSGPWSTRRSSLENLLLVQCWRLIRRPLLWRASALVKNETTVPGKSMTHNDFHQNNLLIDRENKLYLIDFENFGPGYWTLDLIYALSTLYATGRVSQTTLMHAMRGPAERYPFLQPLLAIALCAVGTNRRFTKVSLTGALAHVARLVCYSVTGSTRVLPGGHYQP
tara:strand:- start:30790 stop:31731 length:942 start_codon:yes stop_codon:yes gene_type:complete